MLSSATEITGGRNSGSRPGMKTTPKPQWGAHLRTAMAAGGICVELMLFNVWVFNNCGRKAGGPQSLAACYY